MLKFQLSIYLLRKLFVVNLLVVRVLSQERRIHPRGDRGVPTASLAEAFTNGHQLPEIWETIHARIVSQIQTFLLNSNQLGISNKTISQDANNNYLITSKIKDKNYTTLFFTGSLPKYGPSFKEIVHVTECNVQANISHHCNYYKWLRFLPSISWVDFNTWELCRLNNSFEWAMGASMLENGVLSPDFTI